MASKKNITKSFELYATLYQALLLDKKMDKALYEFDLKEHIEMWKQELKEDKDEFMFAITENTGNVAMVLITKRNAVFINGKAVKKLKELFKAAYQQNIETFLPNIVADLLSDSIAASSVSYQALNEKKKSTTTLPLTQTNK